MSPKNRVLDGDDQMNAFAAMRSDKTVMWPFAGSLWTLVLLLLLLIIIIIIIIITATTTITITVNKS